MKLDHEILQFYHVKKQVTGIEPAYPAWEAGVLPMNYTCNKINIVQTGVKVKRRIARENAAKRSLVNRGFLYYNILLC